MSNVRTSLFGNIERPLRCAVHAGNGYLPHQFLDTSSNTRNDLWGGPHPAPRARFTLEVVRALIEVWGCDRVGVKLSPAGGLGDVGMGLKETVETYTYLITELDKMKVIYVTLVRYVERMDVWIEGAKKKTKTPHR